MEYAQMESQTSRVNPIRVAIIDDHPLLREGIRGRLDIEPGFEFAGEHATIAGAIEFLEECHPSVLLLDLSLMDGSGLLLLETIQSKLPTVNVVMLSSYDEAIYATRAVCAGALGYVMKSAGSQSVMNAVRKAAKGKIYLSDFVSNQIQSTFQGDGLADHSKEFKDLSDRELEVMRLIGLGRPVTQIADLLNLAQSTVETYKTRIRHKLGANSQYELIIKSALLLNRYPN